MSWLGMGLPERPEGRLGLMAMIQIYNPVLSYNSLESWHVASSAAPPSYAEIVTEEQRQSSLDVPAAREELDGPLFAYIHEFRFQPPPLYSEVSPK